MNKLIMFTLFSIFAAKAGASDPLNHLKKLEGCFEVTYQFVEDGKNDKLYKPIIEYIRAKEENGKFILEHIGQYPQRDQNGDDILDSNGNIQYFVQYHWREEWKDHGNKEWSQIVYGPFNDYRYTCKSKKWSLNQFHCHTDKAVKPRRDRNRPYDHMIRVNNIHINDKQWVHGQRNKKMFADGSLHSVEMGWNTYKRVDQEICRPSINANPGPIER